MVWSSWTRHVLDGTAASISCSSTSAVHATACSATCTEASLKERGVLHAWLTPGVLLTPRNAAEKCGFDIDNDLAEAYSVPSESYWDILLEEWKFLIRQRRENG